MSLLENALEIVVEDGNINQTRDLMKSFNKIKRKTNTDDVRHLAVHVNNTELLQTLLQQNAENVDEKNKEGLTPLHLAARCGNIKLIKVLL